MRGRHRVTALVLGGLAMAVVVVLTFAVALAVGWPIGFLRALAEITATLAALSLFWIGVSRSKR